ncbi:MAG TPA: HisA/HisF-related TIM barrel protein [Steroidobacteraceae bacterium]|jgi:cyclase|nr:HisA/HisF-related TIM barrel protein [Steroidobacteraceae bacterium]
MLKKRLVGVITVKDGRAVQSFGYGRHLPLGTAQCLAENLDRWGADEILVLCIDRSRRGLGPDLALLRQLGSLGLSTPLSFGGGIRTAADAAAVIQSGAERVCLDALLRTNPAVVGEISTHIGAQAVIGVLPLAFADGTLQWLDYLSGRSTPLSVANLALFASRTVSEALVIDWRNEGRAGGFDERLVRHFPLAQVPLIAFGGVSEAAQLDTLLAHDQVVAVGSGNFLAYREHAVQKLRQRSSARSLRSPIFGSEG